MNMEHPQPTYMRQRFLLALVQQTGNSITATDLQKLVFMYMQKEKRSDYEFIPYMYGAYSFQLADDIEILRKNGYLVPNNSCIRASFVSPNAIQYRIESERGKELIQKAYRQYPYYAINSIITKRILSLEEAAVISSARDALRRSEQVLFNIGYEGKTIEGFINTLIHNDIRVLCDVRKNPLSRKFGFSKAKLERVTSKVGIKYIHIPELGIESEKRQSLDTIDDYKKLFSEYSNTLVTRMSYLEQVYILLSVNTRIALMCYEKDSCMCHRHVIRDYLLSEHQVRSIDL